MTCHKDLLYPAKFFCCVIPCPANVLLSCPAHTFSCPPWVGDGCCAIGLYCNPNMCLKYEYKTLRAYSPLTITISVVTENVEFYPTTSTSEITTPPDSHVTTAMGYSTCAWPNCQPGISGLKVLELPISDRVLGTPTAPSARMAEVAYGSGARNLRPLSRERARLVSVGIELTVVAGAMVLL